MIVITTPTGQIGSRVLERVLETDTPVRVIVRDPARLDARVRERVDVVQGSTNDVDVLTKAFAGADAVFWLTPPNPTADSVVGHTLDFTGPLCEALLSQGVARVVAVSSLGRDAARDAGLISATRAIDALIESTGVHYRALCPPGFMENTLRQFVPITTQGMIFGTAPGDHKHPLCATRDIADTAAALLLDDTWDGQEGVPLHGPEDLSGDDTARIISEVLGRPVRYQQIPMDAYQAGMLENGMSEAWVQGIVSMVAQIDRGLYDTDPRTPESTTPTTFRQWCEDVLKPAVQA